MQSLLNQKQVTLEVFTVEVLRVPEFSRDGGGGGRGDGGDSVVRVGGP